MFAKKPIYLDSNAGAPLLPEVAEVLRSFLSDTRSLGNPSSIHQSGRSARKCVTDARESIAASLGPGVLTDEIQFASSGTEANQTVLRSLAEWARQEPGKVHWITTPVEHESVLLMEPVLREQGVRISHLPVDTQGAPLARALDRVWRTDCPITLVSAIWVNNETGVITDVGALGAAAKARGALVHLDAAQAWGKIHLNLKSGVQADFVTLSGHKIGAPAGIGCLWTRSETAPRLRPLLMGKQEKKRRGGTENLLGIVGLGVAAAQADPTRHAEMTAPTRDLLEEMIRARVPQAIINGADAPRVANTLNVSFPGVIGSDLVMALDLEGYALSSGAACSSGVSQPSHVLQAMGCSEELARSSLRISLHQALTPEECRAFVDTLERVVLRLTKGSPDR